MATDDTALTEQITDAVRQALSDGDALQCARVWEAWLYKTMTDEDFTDASDGPLPDEIAAAVLPIVREAQAEALREAAMFWSENPDELDDETPGDIRNWMRDRADQIEKETP